MPVLALAVLPLLPRATRRADLQREKAGRATELASDTVAGLRVLRGIGGEELFLGRYRRASQEVRRAAVRSARMWSLISAVQVLLPGLLLVAVVWYGARLALDGRITVGELVTVYSAVAFLLFPLRHFEEIAMAYSFSRPSAKRAARVLALRHAPRPAPATGDRPRYGAAAADRSTAAASCTTRSRGLLAPAGPADRVVCGDPDAAGRLADRLGGHPARPDDAAATAPSVAARRHAAGRAAAGRRPHRRAGPGQGPGAALRARSRELLDVPSSGAGDAPTEALAAAQCGDVLDALAAGAPPTTDGDPMRTRITERGRSLSGGQRQRLALARSLVTDPEVLVLDEPTSAVDAHTEARIAEGLRALRAGRTTVVLTSQPAAAGPRRPGGVRPGGHGRRRSATHRELLRTRPALPRRRHP